MKSRRLHLVVRQALGMVCVLLLLAFPAGVLLAQNPAPAAPPSLPAQALSPDQLDTLVAPVALYPMRYSARCWWPPPIRWRWPKRHSGCNRIETCKASN